MHLFLEKPNNTQGAVFNVDKTHRYVLWRIWDETLPVIAFIGLNPSIADATADDPTLRRVIGFAKRWGYGGVYMLNLFSFVTPYPKELKTKRSVSTNLKYLKHWGTQASEVIFAWGNYKDVGKLSQKVRALFPEAKALQLNKNGSPRHPLYVKANATRFSFDQ